ncbi:hypothetical protein RAY_277 [Erwinia phage vB_EamM_RAY]|jgi:hypothetical protein|uniref:Uncharacterized protein n=5 Tax=Agricanvirus TaxID=1984776 RepID=A0A173GEI6_9CAUD|nr:hypothetical protein Ea357_273 [Erwinia phage Ea35-70]YP_009605426.1 hypothetical protein FDH97_gp283 [Erwinia phage vB_EamM_Deimos-Minion]YP_009605743.1 hypothetical protein FDH98_gp241 [Erwinia phage vB_EamM_RAY]AUG86066.1 hypothetical protein BOSOLAPHORUS_280 [Erwinia phage vB_EamM_Bosolaphorus]QBP07384.1 hypothetical protein REBECCA_279 [Erwinia phage Rebecca]AHI60427.1 hypothetical protein Ea357_273 [Erwinia phage Ea35-70]ANH52057.1 hypothetical protein RAY_277 [Erwinia phage vB_EamM_
MEIVHQLDLSHGWEPFNRLKAAFAKKPPEAIHITAWVAHGYKGNLIGDEQVVKGSCQECRIDVTHIFFPSRPEILIGLSSFINTINRDGPVKIPAWTGSITLCLELAISYTDRI